MEVIPVKFVKITIFYSRYYEISSTKNLQKRKGKGGGGWGLKILIDFFFHLMIKKTINLLVEKGL